MIDKICDKLCESIPGKIVLIFLSLLPVWIWLGMAIVLIRMSSQ